MRAKERAIEAEYEAARVEFIQAQRRMTAAKAAMKPIWEARYEAKRNAEWNRLRRVAQAYLDGAPRDALCVLAGRKTRARPRDLLYPLWDRHLSYDDMYEQTDGIEVGSPAWERLMTERALARHHEEAAA